MAKYNNYLYEFYEEGILNGIAPELYINKEILPKENIFFKENYYKVYKINEDLFYEDDRNQNDLLEFNLELKNENEDYDELTFEIKENVFYVLVNSIITLSRFQWNTIIVSDCGIRCLVCDIIIEDPNNHIETDSHVVNLNKHKPLKKFDLHITRLIGDKYHCAVCNEVYEKYNNTHLDSKRHIERMLFATNRAFIDYDFDNKDDNKIKSGIDSDGFYDLNDFTNNKSTIRSFASVVKTEEKDSLLTEVPMFIEHVIGNKTFTIKSDSYHMILKPNGKEFYCMLCIKFDDVSNTSEHCKSEEHLKKLEQCKIMNIHEEHFIRKVTTKYYHCGTCNNLQLIGDIEAHLKRHVKKHENQPNEGNEQHEINVNSDKRNEQGNKINENYDKVPKNIEHRRQNAQLNVTHDTERSLNLINPNLDNDIIVNHFNCVIRISFMSYNLILNHGVDFYCLLCNVVFPRNTLHFKDASHVVRVVNFHFEPFFGINLVRMLNQCAHCAICNVVVNLAEIHLHTLNPIHLFLLNKALNPNNNIPAMNQTNVAVEPVKTQVFDLCQTFIDSKSLEYDKDNLDILEEFVHLNIKNSFVKVSYLSYHTLVHTGDGNRYCFMCSYKITKSLREHIESEAHLNRMKTCKFVMNYKKDLLRQVKLTYHCCFCNVLVKKSDIEKHLIWPVHEENANIQKKLRKRKRKLLNNIIKVDFHPEEECLNEQESQMQFVFQILFEEKVMYNIGGIVINIPPTEKCGGKIVNISWDAWQGITRYDHKVYCHICQDHFFDIDTHLEEDSHKNGVSKPIEKQYLPACIRKINALLLNCVTCNLVFPNKKKNVSQHLAGKKHVENYDHHLKRAGNIFSLK